MRQQERAKYEHLLSRHVTTRQQRRRRQYYDDDSRACNAMYALPSRDVNGSATCRRPKLVEFDRCKNFRGREKLVNSETFDFEKLSLTGSSADSDYETSETVAPKCRSKRVTTPNIITNKSAVSSTKRETTIINVRPRRTVQNKTDYKTNTNCEKTGSAHGCCTSTAATAATPGCASYAVDSVICCTKSIKSITSMDVRDASSVSAHQRHKSSSRTCWKNPNIWDSSTAVDYS